MEKRIYLKLIACVYFFYQVDSYFGNENVNDDRCESIEFVSRKEWRARAPVRRFAIKLPVSHVIIINTVMGACKNSAECVRNVQFIQDYHQDNKGWWDIAYNFLIGGDGRVYVAVGWHHVGEHSLSYNSISMGIALMGNFSIIVPTEHMLNTTQNLIQCGIRKGYLTPYVEIHGHRDVVCTDSPGFWDIAYNFLVGGDGRVYVGKGWHITGEHSLSYNMISMGIALLGNFSIVEPSEIMLNTTLNLIKCGIQNGYLIPSVEIHGHRDVLCTESPGNKLYAKIKKWKNFKGGKLPLYACLRT